MNVLSLFDGMSCGQLALNRAGIKYDTYYSSEIDKNAIKVTQHNYPNTIQLGNVTQIKSENLPKIDLMIGGSPCQGFSFAGKQLNFNDERSKLFFEFVKLLKELSPKYFLLENVAMKKEYEKVISDHLGVEPIMINSALVSAQNRKRLYWTNIPNVTQPEDKGLTWSNVREHDWNSETFYYTEKFKHCIDRSNMSICSNFNNSNSKMLEAFYSNKKLKLKNLIYTVFPYNAQAVASIRGRCIVNGKIVDNKMKIAGLSSQYIEFRYDGKTNCLSTVCKDNVVVPYTLPNRGWMA